MSDQPPVPPPPKHDTLSLSFFILLLCSAIFAVIYQVLYKHQLIQGAALFIGLPVILGSVVAFAGRPSTVLGLVLKVTTLLMCVVAPLMGEGAICIVMAAPLIYGLIGLAALISLIVQRYIGPKGTGCLALLVGLLPMAWDAREKSPGWEQRRPAEEISDAVEIAAPPQVVWQALAGSPDPRALPAPGFMQLRRRPGPRWIRGTGLAPGDVRHIRFDNDAYTATVVSATPGREVRFAVRQEQAAPGERIALWLGFDEVRLAIEPLPGGRSLLRQTTRYRRLLDPALYFAPMERYGVHAMHRYTLGLCTGLVPAQERPPRT